MVWTFRHNPCKCLSFLDSVPRNYTKFSFFFVKISVIFLKMGKHSDFPSGISKQLVNDRIIQLLENCKMFLRGYMVWRRCQEIDPFRLSISFSQYSEDIQQSILFQSWTFSCQHAVFLMNTTEVQTSQVSSHGLYWENKIDKRKRSIRGICMNFELKTRTLFG